MILLLVLAQTITPAPLPADDGVIHRERNSLELPDKIAPALVPYLACVFETSNDEILKGQPATTGAIILAAQARAVDRCRNQRATAKAGALALLASDNRSATDREKEVEHALSGIERSFDAAAETLDRRNNVTEGAKK